MQNKDLKVKMKPYIICRTFIEIDKMFEQEFMKYDTRQQDDDLLENDESCREPEPLLNEVFMMDNKEI